MINRSALAVAMVMLAGCGPSLESPEREDVASTRSAIVGGTLNPGDPEVFMLFIQGNNGTGSGCTATLIDSRTLLTAAHCVDPRTLNAASVQIWAMNKPNQNQVAQTDLIRVTETRYHPNWNPNTSLGFDIAVALLEKKPAGVTPKPWNKESVAGKGGQPLRAIGYGTTGNDMGSGVKRQVALTFRQISQDLIYLGNQSSKGVCHGDSGGPSFHTFPDGVERVVGVHSFTITEQCVDGADTRVDTYQSFINTWLAQKEAPSCGEDGRCAMNCPQLDYDCVCAGDGQCTTACPDLAKDPDCPKTCTADGICTQSGGCPFKDFDCKDFGEACSSPTQCSSNKCVTDPQSTGAYCSVSCTATSGNCGAGFECDATGKCIKKQLPVISPNGDCVKGQTICQQNFVCSGATSAGTKCVASCTSTAGCSGTDECLEGFDGQKFCQTPPKKPDVFLALAKIDEPAFNSGCSSVSGGLFALWAVVGLLRRRRS